MNINREELPLETLQALLDEVYRDGHPKMTVGGLRREAGSDNAAIDIHICDHEGTLVMVLTVDFHDLLEFSADHHTSERLEIADLDHPILWPYTTRHAELYFYSAATNPKALSTDLHELHARAVLKWFPTDRFLNNLLPLHKLLGASNGCLARGPLPLIRVYEAALQEAGVSCSVLESYRSTGEETNIPVALLMGTTYFIARDLRSVQAVKHRR